MSLIMSMALDNTRKFELLSASVVAFLMAGLIILVDLLVPRHIPEPVVLTQQMPISVFPDFASIQSIKVKKQQFFDYLQDYVVAENERITEQRIQLVGYADIANSGGVISDMERAWVFDLARLFKLDLERSSDLEIINELLLRVDVIPVSLVLAQAANESAWGTSRFAVQGNNIFGQWCYVQGCGLIPQRRASGAKHEVKAFASVDFAVRGYFTNINSHHLYGSFRELRAEMRRQQLALDPLILAYGLSRYSVRGASYVEDVQSIITHNDLLLRDQSYYDYSAG